LFTFQCMLNFGEEEVPHWAMLAECRWWRTFGMWYLAKIAAQVGPSALVHHVALVMHQTAMFLVVYGELHFGKQHLYIKCRYKVWPSLSSWYTIPCWWKKL
jgi:hypothetical protein